MYDLSFRRPSVLIKKKIERIHYASRN